MEIEKFSIGIGDRFGRQGLAQLRAVQQAERAGVVVVPVWNKSFREHSLIGTKPDDVRAEADDAVRRAGWKHPYHVDADHIGVKTVDALPGRQRLLHAGCGRLHWQGAGRRRPGRFRAGHGAVPRAAADCYDAA